MNTFNKSYTSHIKLMHHLILTLWVSFRFWQLFSAQNMEDTMGCRGGSEKKISSLMVFCSSWLSMHRWLENLWNQKYLQFICLYNLKLSSLGNDLLLQLKSKVIRTLFLLEDLVILVVFKGIWKEWTRISGLAPQKCYLKRLPQCQVVIFFSLLPFQPFFLEAECLVWLHRRIGYRKYVIALVANAGGNKFSLVFWYWTEKACPGLLTGTLFAMCSLAYSPCAGLIGTILPLLGKKNL